MFGDFSVSIGNIKFSLQLKERMSFGPECIIENPLAFVLISQLTY